MKNSIKSAATGLFSPSETLQLIDKIETPEDLIKLAGSEYSSVPILKAVLSHPCANESVFAVAAGNPNMEWRLFALAFEKAKFLGSTQIMEALADNHNLPQLISDQLISYQPELVNVLVLNPNYRSTEVRLH